MTWSSYLDGRSFAKKCRVSGLHSDCEGSKRTHTHIYIGIYKYSYMCRGLGVLPCGEAFSYTCYTEFPHCSQPCCCHREVRDMLAVFASVARSGMPHGQGEEKVRHWGKCNFYNFRRRVLGSVSSNFHTLSGQPCVLADLL